MELDFQSSNFSANSDLHHIINLSLACKNGLWYDFKNFKLISQTSFSYLLKNTQITNYIDDPNHPIIGNPNEYNQLYKILKEQIEKLHECMKIFTAFLTEVNSFSNVYGSLSTDEKLEGLSKLCFSTDPLMFLAMITLSENFKSKLSDKQVWIKVWKMNFHHTSWEPFENNLMIAYLKLRSQKKSRCIEEYVSKDFYPTDRQLEVLCIKFDLFEGDEIVYIDPSLESKRFRMVSGKMVENGKGKDTLLKNIVSNSYFRV